MAENTSIEWTDATLNAIAGCRKVSPECENCYAINESWRMKGNPNEKIARKFLPVVSKPNWTGKVTFTESALLAPLKRKKPTKYFVNSLSDLFYSEVPDEWIDKHFAVFALAPQHTFQVLTKRPERMLDYVKSLKNYDGGLSQFWLGDAIHNIAPFLSYQSIREARLDSPLPNVWLGCSVGNQKYADERREAMKAISELGWTTFVSYEPALGPVDWTGWEFLDWIVSGGESGAGSRPSHPEWHRNTRDFCQANGIAYLFKQIGAWSWDQGNALSFTQISILRDGTHYDPCGIHKGQHFVGDEVIDLYRVGKKKAGRLLDGRTWDEMPVTR